MLAEEDDTIAALIKATVVTIRTVVGTVVYETAGTLKNSEYAKHPGTDIVARGIVGADSFTGLLLHPNLVLLEIDVTRLDGSWKGYEAVLSTARSCKVFPKAGDRK